MTRKVLSVVLSAAMVLSMTPASALAADGDTAAAEYTPGVTVTKATEEDKAGEYGAAYEAAGYKATFVYEEEDASKEITSVEVYGNLNFYTKEDVQAYVEAGYPKTDSGLTVKSAYEYCEGMTTAHNNSPAGETTYVMAEVEDGVYETAMPLPAQLYEYKYKITYADGTTESIADPANPAVANHDGSCDVIWSTFYVGTSEDTTEAMKDFYPADEAYQGTIQYASITASNGENQNLEIYLPYNYDASKEYKTLYVSHGSGGSETEWFVLGSLKNIMDNLAAKGMDNTIVVSMDNNRPFSNMKNLSEVANNLADVIVPYIEANYSVSKEVEDRAVFGLSAGGSMATTLLQTIPEKFAYVGISSVGRSFPLSNATASLEDIKDTTVSIYSGALDWRTANTYNIFKEVAELGGKAYFHVMDGAHDWTCWTEAVYNFITEVIWSEDTYTEGATVEAVTAKDEATLYGEAYKEAGYKVTFVYKPETEKEISSVEVYGNLNFYTKEDVQAYAEAGYPKTETGLTVKSAFEYRDGMITAHNNSPAGETTYAMAEVEDGVYAITMPLPAQLYEYKYKITYADGTTESIADPANPAAPNYDGSCDCIWSTFYVGTAKDAPEAMKDFYPADEAYQGTIEYATITASNGENQNLEIYLPYNYDASKKYRTLYVSHGSGGSEIEWFVLGSLKNIMDNLAAKGRDNTIVVSMDNNRPFSNMSNLKEVAANLADVIVPYIEANYSVSKSRKDRAVFGLSAGGSMATTLLQTIPEDFGYVGISSVGRSFPLSNAEADLSVITDTVVKFYSGNLDFRTPNTENLCKELTAAGGNASFMILDGAHDWTVWSEAIHDFLTNVVWTAEDHYKVAELQAQIDELKAQMEKIEVLRQKALFLCKKISIKLAKSVSKGKVTITVKKVSGADGYQICYAGNASFKNAKTKEFTGTSVTLKKLTSGKKLYVKVRAGKVVGGKTVHTSYSQKAVVKVK